jgi:predicted thioesterase
MERFAPGQSAEIEAEVTRELTINRMGREGADVLSTPSLLGLMEQCSIKASDPYLSDGHTTVGYAVDGMRHMAPTPIGASVRVRSVLTGVERNRLTFSIEAFEGEKKIGVAVHKRAVISKEEGA